MKSTSITGFGTDIALVGGLVSASTGTVIDPVTGNDVGSFALSYVFNRVVPAFSGGTRS